MSDPQLLLDILDEIMVPAPRIDVVALVQKIKQNGAMLRRERAAQEICDKLRTVTKEVEPMKREDILRVLRQINPPNAVQVPAVLDETWRKLRYGLQQYIQSRGSVIMPMLPHAHRLDAMSAAMYEAFICSSEAADLRWAVCRVLLGLYSQWWWLGQSLTQAHLCDIVQTIDSHFRNHLRPSSPDPWSPLFAVHRLLTHFPINSPNSWENGHRQCRETLISMAREQTS